MTALAGSWSVSSTSSGLSLHLVFSIQCSVMSQAESHLRPSSSVCKSQISCTSQVTTSCNMLSCSKVVYSEAVSSRSALRLCIGLGEVSQRRHFPWVALHGSGCGDARTLPARGVAKADLSKHFSTTWQSWCGSSRGSRRYELALLANLEDEALVSSPEAIGSAHVITGTEKKRSRWTRQTKTAPL